MVLVPGIGGLSIANNVLADSVSLHLNRSQSALRGNVAALSSGLRISTAADDPSGLAIAESLQAQVNGFDAAVRNVQDANNAGRVAEAALQTTTDILQRIRSLAVEASSDLASTTDRAAIQAEISQLLLEINRVSQNTQFNGLNLLDGSHAGFQPAILPTAVITSNTALATGSGALAFLIATVAVAPTAIDATVEVQVVNTGTQILASFVSYNSHAQQTFSYPFMLPATSLVVLAWPGTGNLCNFQLGSFATADVGTTAFIKLSQGVAAASNPTAPAFNFQSGANEGSTIQVAFAATNTQTLRVSDLSVLQPVANFGPPALPSLAAEDAIGQVDNALQMLLQDRAVLGATIVRLNEDAASDNVAAVNLQASESGIRDLNVGQAASAFTKEQVLVQIGTLVLGQSNANAQSVLPLLR